MKAISPRKKLFACAMVTGFMFLAPNLMTPTVWAQSAKNGSSSSGSGTKSGSSSGSSVISPKPLSDIIVFGGPLEDIGNLASVAGDLPPPFYKNRFADGPLAIDIVAERFGIEIKPSLHRVGPTQGNNYSSVDSLAAGNEPQDLAGQLDAYFASTGNRADRDALYYLIIGGNEVIAATFETDDEVGRKIVDAAIDAKEKAIRRLVAAGAKTILAPNFINIGVTPQIREAGLTRRGEKFSRYHNRRFARMLDHVDRNLDFQLIRHDFEQFVNDGLRNSKTLGYTNTTDSCIDRLATGECDFDRYIFFNDLFPTASIHELWGWDIVLTVVESLRTCHQYSGKSKSTRNCRRLQYQDSRRQSKALRHPIN